MKHDETLVLQLKYLWYGKLPGPLAASPQGTPQRPGRERFVSSSDHQGRETTAPLGIFVDFFRCQNTHQTCLKNVAGSSSGIPSRVEKWLEMQVLRNDLEWEEERWDSSSHFVGKKVVECVVHQDEERGSEAIWLVMTLANQDGSQETVKLSSTSQMDLSGHYIIHAFLSDPKSGCVIEDFPLQCKILQVTRVHRAEKGRSWSCCGHSMNDGCYVQGLKFVLSDQDETSERHVILHSWEQCKPLPFCGDPHSPSYRLFRVRTYGDPPSKRSGFLPADFLEHIGCGTNFCPLDASGMLVAGTTRGKSFRYCLNTFGSVRKQLGFGEWGSPGPFWNFRETYSGEKLIQVFQPSEQFLLGPLGIGIGSPSKWQEIFTKTREEEPTHCTILHGTYESVQDIWRLPPSRITSRELNAAVNVRSRKLPALVVPASKSQQVLSKFLLSLTENPQAEAISVRFTDGTEFHGLGLPQLGARSTLPFKSKVQHGCQGASLGFHLTVSSEMRKVITLHGSVDNLISDLEQACAGPELELCKRLIHDGKASEVLGMRCGHDYSGGPGREVMSMRISNPSVKALMACSMIMPDGQVKYDTKTKAFYPITWDGGNLRREAACALILEILKAMKKDQMAMADAISVIRIQEIH